jgi:hypothetical protein
LSLPGKPPSYWALPNRDGTSAVTFEAPKGPDADSDISQLWFECQALPADQDIDPYRFQWVDYSEWTGPRPRIKVIANGVGVLTLTAFLDKPYIVIFDRLAEAQRMSVCAKCNIDIVGGGVTGLPGGPKGVAAAMAGAAIASEACRECARERIRQIEIAAEVAAAAARSARERADREREAREARERWKEIHEMNEALERYERWKDIA